MKFFLFLIFLFYSGMLSSQAGDLKNGTTGKHLELGWKAGVNWSKFVNIYKVKEKFDYISGVNAGFFVKIHNPDHLMSLAGLISYESRGTFEHFFSHKIKTKYLNLQFTPELSVKFVSLYSGLYFGYLIQSQEEFSDRSAFPVGALNIKDLKRTDFGIPIGLRVKLFDIFYMDVSYAIGLQSILDIPTFSPGGARKSEVLWNKNRTFSVSLIVVAKNFGRDIIHQKQH